jgi:hypothetical protein
MLAATWMAGLSCEPQELPRNPFNSQRFSHLLLTGKNMESIGLGMARTGGMVVITVLLSVAMFLLVVGLIVALALGARK